jgi:CheY-like chemotaxis protein
MPGSICPRNTQPKIRVLYLGVHQELIDSLRKGLNETGYQIVSCADGESAITFLKSDISYQLLLIDFDWREHEVLKLASVARLLKHRKPMPIVLVATTELSRQVRALARNAGVNECVPKATDPASLIQTIRRLTV